MTDYTSRGHVFATAPGELRPSNDILHDETALRQRIKQDGYLLLRGLLDKERVLAARHEILNLLKEVGEIDPTYPLMEARSSGTSKRENINNAAFNEQLRTGPALRQLTGSGRIIDFYERFLGQSVKPLDFIWLRNVANGFGTGCHFDWVYMGRGTQQLYTSWIPLGDVPRSDGTLVILEGSHRQVERIRDYARMDVDRDAELLKRYKGGWFSQDPNEVQAKLGGRWLTSDFEAGDILVFTMFTMHCSLDNVSPENRVRLSCDARYQAASEIGDERWVGPNPPGHSANFV